MAAPSDSYSYDFEKGIPDDFILIDLDGCTLSTDVMKFGFTQGDSWIACSLPDEDNVVACSTSWYSPAGTSSDWLILPTIHVDEGMTLRWRGKAFDRNFRDGYFVAIATSGGDSPDDFEVEAPIFKTNAELNEWIFHTISLNEYVGMDIRIAFVNDSKDCSRLFIDDIAISSPKDVNILNKTNRLLEKGEPLLVNIETSTDYEDIIEVFAVSLSIGNDEFVSEYQDLTISPNSPTSIVWETPFSTFDTGSLDYTISLKHSKGETKIDGTAIPMNRLVVAEEGTGTWCGFCVRGIYNMECMKERYPDKFFGIAIHSNDVMQLRDYTPGDVMTYSGLPCATMNRSYVCDPSDFELYFNKIRHTPPSAAVISEAIFNEDDDNLTVTSQILFESLYSDKDYRLAYVAVENNVHHPDDERYYQSNAYSGESDSMGGFENMPPVIPPNEMWFQDVARSAYGNPKGEAGEIPNTISSFEPIVVTKTLPIPSNVGNHDQMELLIMLINAADGSIINACNPKLNIPSGIPLTKEESIIKWRFVPDGIEVCSDDEIFKTALYSLNGVLISETNDRYISYDSKNPAILCVYTSGRIFTYKICRH